MKTELIHQPKIKSRARVVMRVIAFFALLVLIAFNGVGIYFGAMIYEEANVAYAREHRAYNEARRQAFEKGKAEGRWEDVEIVSPFGYRLRGTFIPAEGAAGRTVVFLHGFTQNRLDGLDYLDIYRRAGYHVLLVDLRAHGESGGESVTWGVYEKYDLDAWIDWIGRRFPRGKVGVHGVSMGAATALMHAGLDERNPRAAFYIADSSYAELEPLLKEKIREKLDLEEAAFLPDLLFFYGNIVSYYKERFTFCQSSPLEAARHIKTPTLYLHGEADELIPPEASRLLYDHTPAPKALYTFPGAKHASSIYQDRRRYEQVVEAFLRQYGE